MSKILCRHGKKDWCGDDPECGFTKTGKFRKANWMCELLNDLRHICGEHKLEGIWSNNQNLYVRGFDWDNAKMPCGTTHIIISVYKSRGHTEGIWLLKGDRMLIPTEKQCQRLLKYFKQEKEKK